MSVKVTVLDANQALSAHQVEQGGVLVLQAQNNVNYQLTDQATGFGPQNIITKRQGDDLFIMLDDGNLEPDIVIENYYDQEGAQIIGLHENGNLYAYVPQSGEVSQSISLLAEEVMASQALGGTELAVPFWAFNPWWLSGAGAVLALAGVVAAAGGGSKNSGGQDNTPPSAPKVESVQHTGTNSSFVKGTAEPNTTVYIRDAQGVVIGEGKTDANGNFEITTTRAVTTDDKLVVTAKDGAGRESSEFELNTNTATNESNVVPSVSNTKNNIENGAIVSTTLTVKASPNTLVEVRDTQGNVIGRGYTDASGNVEITTTTPLMAQPYNVVALSPLGKESQPAEVTGDTTAPSRPTATLENNFEERTGEDGNTVKTIVSANVVGKADPKATVKLLDANGNPVKDENNNDITTMADEDGTYSFKNLPALPHGQNYTVIAEDASGLPSPNAKAVSDHLEPKSPIVTGVVNGVNDAGQPITTISGVGEKEGDLIDILGNDGNLITTVKVNRDLSFSAVVPPMKTGDNFSVIEKDSAQNVSKPASAKGNTEQVEAPSLNLIENEHGGLTAEGYAAPGATVSVVFPNGETRTVKADETGFYSIVDFVPQKAGDTAKVSASQVNVFGNSSPSTEKTYAKDQRAPEVELNETTYGKNEDAQPTQTISGKTEIGATVLLKGSDGSEVPATVNEKGEFEATLPAKDKDGNPITYVVEASDINSSKAEEKVVADNETDAPQFTVSQAEDGKLVVSQKAGTAVEPNAMVEVTFPDGTTQTVQANEEGKFEPVQSEKAQKAGANQTVSAKATDDKGNSSSMPDAVTVEVAEPKVVAQKAVLDDSNAPESNELTIEAQPEIPFIVTDAQGNEIGRGQTGKDGKQVITTTRPLQEGEEIKVIALDPQDPTNEEKQKTTTLKTDTNAPSEPSIEFVQNDDGTVTARVGNNLQANEPGSTIEVTFPDGTKGSAVVKADGTFDPITSAQPQPNGDAKATQIDEANNSSEPVTENYQDKKEPVAPSVNSEATLPNGNSEIRGTAEPNSTVTLKDKDGKVLGQAKADDKGNFVIESNEPLMDGADYQVTATDANGNESPKADVTADTKVNEPSVEITENPDGTLTVSPKLGTDGTPLKDENGQPLNEPGSTIDVTFPDGTIGKAVVNPDGSFAPIVSEKPQTSGELSVTATDNKGNTSNATEEYTDEKEPTAPQISENKNNQNEFGEPESTTVTGTAEPNSVVSIIDPATGEVLGEGKADKDGNFIITTNKALEDKPYDVKATDEAGNSSTPTEVKGDTDVPNKPSISFKQDENGIITATVGDNPQANEPGSIIEVTFPDGSKGSAVVKADGTFDPIMSEQPQIRGGEASAVAKDEQGNSSDPDVAIFEDKIKPALPHVDSVKNNHHDHTTTLSGNAEPGALVELKDEKGNLIGAVQADDKGDFTLVVPTLEHGAPFTLTAKDENNNTSDAIPVVGDTVAPKSPAPTVESIVAGQDENGKPITVLKGKVEGAEKGTKVTVTDPNTNEVLGTAETDENGEFTLETIKPLDNSLNYPLTAIDSYNNVSQPTPVTTDLDKDGVTNEEEAQAKADIEKALETAKKAEEEYKKALEDAGNAIDQGEKEKLDALAKVAEEAKKAVRDLIDNLPKTTGNTEADQAYAKEQQDKLDELNSDVPVANDADGDDISDETEANAKQAVEKAVEKAQKAKETYDQALKDAGNAISDEEKAELDKLAKAVEDAKEEAKALIDNLPTTIGNTEGDQAYKAEQQAKLDAVKADVPAANDADSDNISNEAEETAKQTVEQAVTNAVANAQAALETYNAKKAELGNAYTEAEVEELKALEKAVEDAKEDAQALIDNLPTTIGNTEGDQAYKAEQQAKLDAVKADVPAANDADSDNISNEAEETAKQTVEQAVTNAVANAQAALETYNAKKAELGNAYTEAEVEELKALEKAVEDAKKDAQALIDNLPTTIGNTEGDQAYKAEQQAKLDAVKADVPAANDADSDNISNEAEETAKQTVEQAVTNAVANAQAALETYNAKKAELGNAYTEAEVEELKALEKAVEDAKKDAQALIDNLPTTIGNTEGDQAYKAEQQAKLDAVKADVPAANDADSDNISNEAEETAKQTVEQAVTNAVANAQAALETYNAKKAELGNAYTEAEVEELKALEKAVEDAKKDAQALIDNLPTTIGNTEGDQAYKAEQQAKLDAVKADVPAANDADSDNISNEAEETAKQTVEQAVTNAVANAQAALETYNAKKAELGNAYTEAEVEELKALEKAVEDAKKDAQALIDNLPTTIGNTEGDQAYKAEQQAKLDAVKADVPAANDADSDNISNEAEETAKQTVEQAVTNAVANAQAALETYNAKKAELGNAYTEAEVEELKALEKAVEDAKKDAQALIDNLPTTIGNTEGDQAYKAEQQAKLDAVKADVPAANDADSDNISNEAEETAKQTVEQAVTNAVANAQAALETYNAKKAELGNAYTEAEVEELKALEKAVEDAKKDAQALIDNLPTTIGNTEGDQAYKAEQQAKLDAVKADVPAANDADSDNISNEAEETAKQTVEQAVTNAVANAQAALETYNAKKAELGNAYTEAEVEELKALEKAVEDAKKDAQALIDNLPTTIGNTEGDQAYKAEQQAKLDAVKAVVPAANDADSDDISDNAENTAKSEIQQKVQAAQNALTAYNNYLNDTALSTTAPNKGEVINPTEAAELARLKGDLEQKLQDAQNALNNDWPTQVGTTESDNTDKQQLTNALGGITVPQDRPANDVNDNGIADDQDYINANTAYTQALADVNAINEKIRALTAENADDATKALTPAEREALVNEANVAKAKLNTAKDALAKVPNSYANPTNADETYAKLNEKVSALAVLEVPQANSTAGVKPDEQLVQEAQTELASAKAKVDEINRKLAETPIINANNKPALDQEAAAAQQALNDAKAKIGALPTTTLPTNKTDKADLTTEANKLTVNPVVSNDDDNDNISNSAEQQAISTAEQKVQAAVNAKTEYDRAKTAAEADGVISQAEARDLETKATTLNNAIRDAKPAVEGLSPAQIGSTPADVSKEAELNGRIPETVVAPPTNDTDNDGVSDAAEAETLKNLGLTAEAPNKDKVTQAEEAKQAYDTYLTKAQTSGGAAPNDKATLNNDELAELARLKADYETKRTAAQDAVTGLAGKLGNSTEDSTTTQKGFQDRLDRLGDIELPKTIKPETSFNLASDPYQPTTLGQMTASVDNDTSLPQDSTWAVSYFSKAQNARVTLNLTKGASGWALDAGQTAETGVTVNANGTIVFDKGSLKDAEEMTSLVTVGSESDTAVTRAPITGESVKGVPTDWTLYDGDESGTTNYDDVIILEKQLDRQGATGKGTLNLGRGEDKLVIGIQGQDLSKNDTGLSNFNVDMGEGDDTVVIYDKILNSTVDLGEGNNRITIGTVHGDVARSSGESQILAGAGNDRLEFVTESRDGNRHRTGINGSARINLGDGENVVDTSKAQTGVNFRSEVTTGSGNDTFDFRNAILQPAAPSNDGSTAPGYLRSGDGADVVRLGGTGSLVNQTPPRGERIDAEVNKGHGVDLGKGDDTLFLDPVLTPLMSSGRGILTSFIGTYETGELKGGEGFDRLVVDFNTQQLNAERKLTGGRGHHANDEFKLNLYLVSGFEEIDMSHDGKHTLNNVIALNQATRVQYVTPPNGVALAQNQGTISGTDKTGLLVKGTEEDKVDLAGRGNDLKQADTLNHGGVIYDHYEFQGNHIYIQQGIQII